MQELFRVIEDPRICSYLPGERASLEIRLVTDMTPLEYRALMERGYRRFGIQVFRPACRSCSECRSMRVLVQEFQPSRSQKRVLHQNRGIRAELHPAFATAEQVELFNNYHRFMHEHRGWPLQRVNLQTYYRDFVAGAADSGKQWLYFDDTTLVGVALMDKVPGAISLVYCYYHPEWRDHSLGTWSILNQFLWAKAAGLQYAYLGYWVQGCQSLSYKSRYVPHEILQGLPGERELPAWKR
jgi:arginyl-tRNA--protein-N-Asp/Glu arginylyltransferase